jgi:hypothetical protein
MQITAFRNALVHNINSNGQQLGELIMPKAWIWTMTMQHLIQGKTLTCK